MTEWEYISVRLENGWVTWDDRSGSDKNIILASALRLFGSQGFELVTSIGEGCRFGRKMVHTLVFKRPKLQG